MVKEGFGTIFHGNESARGDKICFLSKSLNKSYQYSREQKIKRLLVALLISTLIHKLIFLIQTISKQSNQ